MARLEHVNIAVRDPKATAKVLSDLFDWKTRWEGPALRDGFTVHVGDEETYLALYRHSDHAMDQQAPRYTHLAAMNHIGIVVDDLAKTELRVKTAGFETHSHADYEPGQRFYFDGPDGVEYEIISYA